MLFLTLITMADMKKTDEAMVCCWRCIDTHHEKMGALDAYIGWVCPIDELRTR